MLDIQIKTIPHDEQPYDTAGNWEGDSPGWEKFEQRITVSELGDRRYEALVAVHELVEQILCNVRGIMEQSVTWFDTHHPVKVGIEVGDDVRAPYHREHMFASAIERLLAHELGVDWNKYEAAVDKLAWRVPVGERTE